MQTERIQSDNETRVVALSNLDAMCQRVSGVSHRFWVESVSANRCKLGYSNPDEYGNEDPMYVIYPCYRSRQFGQVTTYVVLDSVGAQNDPDYRAYDIFCQVTECPQLWRSNADSDDWQTEREIVASHDPVRNLARAFGHIARLVFHVCREFPESIRGSYPKK